MEKGENKMKIKGIRREEKRFKDRYKMRYHGVLGLSRGQRNALKKMKGEI